MLHTMPTQELIPTQFIREAVRSLRTICSHYMHFSRYTHSIQMLQEMSLKMQMIFPDAPDIYRETVYKWRVSKKQVPCWTENMQMTCA